MMSTRSLRRKSIETDSLYLHFAPFPTPADKEMKNQGLYLLLGLIQTQALFYVERIKSWPSVNSRRPALPGHRNKLCSSSLQCSGEGVFVAVVCF